MRFVYEALFCVDDEGMFCGYVPDCPECQVRTFSFEEAIGQLCDALEEALSAALCDGIEPPAATFGHKVYYGFFSVALCVHADDSANYQVVSAAQAADMLGVSRPRVSALLKSGQLDGYREGRNSWVYARSIKRRLADFAAADVADEAAYADGSSDFAASGEQFSSASFDGFFDAFPYGASDIFGDCQGVVADSLIGSDSCVHGPGGFPSPHLSPQC